MGYVRRRRPIGGRVDLIEVDPSLWSTGLDNTNKFVVIGDLARDGLRAMADAKPSQRTRLADLAAFADFLADRMQAVLDEWKERREKLFGSGELPGSGHDEAGANS